MSEKAVSINDVARLAGVSPATVSNALTGRKKVSAELARKVDAAVRALDYHPDPFASMLRSGDVKIVAVLVPDLDNPFFTSIVSAVEQCVGQVRGMAPGEVILGPSLRIGIEDIEPSSGLQKRESADARSLRAFAQSSGCVERGHGRAPNLALRTSFQSPPSIGGRSRANGIPNCSASDRWRSAKRSPGPLASVALHSSAPGTIAASASCASSAAIVPGPMPPPVAA